MDPFLSSICLASDRSLRTTIFIDVASALIAHICFREFEPENIRGGLIRFVIFAVAPVVTAVLFYPLQPWLYGLLHLVLFTYVLFSSILLYRISPFHPMAKYPGPIICKLSKLWMAWLFHKGKVHLYIKGLHDQYGPIVRIGPNELSIVEVNLIPDILGQQGMPKGPMWEGRQPHYIRNRKTGGSIISLRDADLHAKQRKSWSRAFAPGPLKDYEDSVVARTNEMIRYLKENCQSSPHGVGRTDISMKISYLSLDMMGDTAFGEGFHFLRDGDSTGCFEDMQNALFSTALTTAVPWSLGLMHFVQSFAHVSGNSGQFSKFSLQLARRRVERVAEKRDLFYHLASDMEVFDAKTIISNASFAIFAGSDTTSSVLCGIIYYLLRHPQYLLHLQNEIDEAFPPSENIEIRIDRLTNLKWLNAIIDETLRLQPPLLSYMQRAPAEKSEGKLLGENIFIPKGTAVIVPPYALHRDHRYFSPNPDVFWPERWFTSDKQTQTDDLEKIVLNRSAFIPFSIGPASCTGRPLAMTQLRYIIALLVYTFDMEFDDGYNPEMWEMGILDKFQTIKGALPVQMKVRSGKWNVEDHV